MTHVAGLRRSPFDRQPLVTAALAGRSLLPTPRNYRTHVTYTLLQ